MLEVSRKKDSVNSVWKMFQKLLSTLWTVFKSRIRTSALSVYVKSSSDDAIKNSVDKFKSYLNETNSAISSVSKSIDSFKGSEGSFIVDLTLQLLNGYRAKLVELQYTLASRLQKAFETLLLEIGSLNVSREGGGTPIPVPVQ